MNAAMIVMMTSEGKTMPAVAAIAPVAGGEWKRSYDDVTWDPDEAKRRAKDDPTKPEVEL